MAEVRSLIIGLLLFSGVIVGMSVFYADLTSSTNLAAYGLTSEQIANITPENLRSRSITENIRQQTEDIRDKLNEQPTGITPIDLAWGYINSGISALKLTLSSVDLFTTMVSDATVFLGLDVWVAGIVLGVISIIIIFSILSAYLKWPI